MKAKSMKVLSAISIASLLAAPAAYGQTQPTQSQPSTQMGQPSAQPGSQQASQPTPESQTYRGQVINEKMVDIKGTDKKNRVVMLKTEDGTRYTIDLGPAQQLTDVAISNGMPLEVQGRVGRVADREIVVAETLIANGKTTKISRSGSKSTGTTGS